MERHYDIIMTRWTAATMTADPLKQGRFYIMETMHAPGIPAPAFAVGDQISISPSGLGEIPGVIVRVAGQTFEATFDDVTMSFTPRQPDGIPVPFRSQIPFQDYFARAI